MLVLKSVIKGHENVWGDASLCVINDMVFFEEFESDDYPSCCCNHDPQATFTLQSKESGLILTICKNHITQLKELGGYKFKDHYSNDIDWDDYDRDGDFPTSTIFQAILDNPLLFVDLSS